MARWRIFLLLISGISELFAQHVSCRTNYYTVTGSDLREIHQSFRRARPWRDTSGHDGFTVWNVSWRFNSSYNGSVCRLTTFSTTTTINITLPRWIAPTNGSSTVKAEWERYIQALSKHEYGHAQYALAAAAETQRRIKEVSEDASCDGLKRRATSLCNNIIEKYKQLDQSYDQRTDHGRNDGARLARGDRPARPPE